jgi:hypothetical protein
MNRLSYCPNCGSEFREGFIRCSECSTELLPGPSPHYDEPAARVVKGEGYYVRLEPVCVLILPSEIDGVIAETALRAYGVRVFAAGTGVERWTEAGNVGRITRTWGPLNDVRIMVHPDDVQAAGDLLHAPPLEAPEETGLPRASWRVDVRKRRRVLRVLVFVWATPSFLGLGYWILAILVLIGRQLEIG